MKLSSPRLQSVVCAGNFNPAVLLPQIGLWNSCGTVTLSILTMSCWCLIVIHTQDVNKGWKDGSLETKTNSSWTFFHTSNDMWKQTWNHFDGLRLFKVMVSVRSYYRGHLGLQLPQPLEPTLPRWWGEFFAFINIFILCSKQSKWWNIISKWWFSSFLCLLERTTTLRAD